MVRIRTHTSSREIEQLRPLWKSIRATWQGTIFQDFEWNLLAAKKFSHREEPLVISAEASHGVAIVPAALRRSDSCLRFLGEELFDYRNVLHDGDDEVLRVALAALAQHGAPLDVTAVRECDRHAITRELELVPFTAAPAVNRIEISAEEFGAMHNRLARNLRRFLRRGFELKLHSGKNSELLRLIYERNAAVDTASLFHDPLRIEFIIEAAQLEPNRCEIFTIESGSRLAAALVTFREENVRRFYTCYFLAEFAKLSPSMALIHEVTRLSLEAGLDCDYLTGEQGYKLRLATSSMPLYKLRATPEQLRALGERVPALRRAG